MGAVGALTAPDNGRSAENSAFNKARIETFMPFLDGIIK